MYYYYVHSVHTYCSLECLSSSQCTLMSFLQLLSGSNLLRGQTFFELILEISFSSSLSTTSNMDRQLLRPKSHHKISVVISNTCVFVFHTVHTDGFSLITVWFIFHQFFLVKINKTLKKFIKLNNLLRKYY